MPALLEHPHAELAGVQSRTQGEARAVAERFGVPRAFAAAGELLDQDLDAVVISSPPHLHYAQARESLARGVHVLVEKPMTLRAAEARELVELARRQRVHLLVSYPWHYTRHAREARRLVREGALGELRLVSVLMTNPVDHLIRGTATQPTYGEPYLSPEASTYSDPAVAGGGQSYAQVSHAAAYLAYLMGARPAQVFARYHNDGCAVDIYDALNLAMENGCLATVASTGATPVTRRDYEVRVFGTRGILFLDLWKGLMEFVPMDRSAAPIYPPLSPEEVYPERAPARNLVDVIRGEAENQSPGELGLAAMEVLEAAADSAQSGRNVVLR